MFFLLNIAALALTGRKILFLFSLKRERLGGRQEIAPQK
jgi:hypothetical protein